MFDGERLGFDAAKGVRKSETPIAWSRSIEAFVPIASVELSSDFV